MKDAARDLSLLRTSLASAAGSMPHSPSAYGTERPVRFGHRTSAAEGGTDVRRAVANACSLVGRMTLRNGSSFDILEGRGHPFSVRHRTSATKGGTDVLPGHRQG